MREGARPSHCLWGEGCKGEVNVRDDDDQWSDKQRLIDVTVFCGEMGRDLTCGMRLGVDTGGWRCFARRWEKGSSPVPRSDAK